jgi:hypothetical protein
VAQDARRNAQRDLDDSGRFRGRQARAGLAAANAQLADANRAVEEANELARPTNDLRAAANKNLAAVRGEHRSHDLIERWQYLPEHVEAAHVRADALNGWRDWAEGKAITDKAVIDVIHRLSVDARSDDSGASAALADVIHRWAQSRGLDLSKPVPAIAPAGIEIDL